ncbi:MAG: hypothetical protein GYB55_19795 [Cytophagales bacterium]|uniref:hypothetical protein n=1 Tax=Cyclobacterium marinum TaxID=104 RepID=UPI0011EBC353|nr:hypothetical protein [Cyclobacterium marinum]MBI0401117.1 hypothetical protein [Cyclobacterium marinum]MBR9777134.1 hypothetical protein [Cytophagales bacterium]
METLIAAINILFFTALLGTILGLIRPVIVLWFMHRFNRMTVLKCYGLPAAILYSLKLALTQWA